MSDDQLAKLYLSRSKFKQIAITKYMIPKDLQNEEKILQLLYVFHWFKINKNDSFQLVYYHPFINKNDMNRVTELFLKYAGYSILPSLLYCIAGLKFYKINNLKNIPLMRINLAHLCLSTIFGISLFVLYFYRRLNKEIKTQPEFKKYFDLKVDIDKIIQELHNYNINLI
jgi:hypothetical protein